MWTTSDAKSDVHHRRRADRGRVRNRQLAVLASRQTGIVPRRRQESARAPRARVRRKLRLHHLSCHHPCGRRTPDRDAGRRGGSARHGVGPDAPIAPWLPGGDHRRRGLRAADVYAELRSGRRRHPARKIGPQRTARHAAGSDAMKWTDSEDIAIALAEKFPGLDPLTLRFTDLRERVLALDGFADDPKASNEAKLEAIQMAWYEEWQDSQK